MHICSSCVAATSVLWTVLFTVRLGLLAQNGGERVAGGGGGGRVLPHTRQPLRNCMRFFAFFLIKLYGHFTSNSDSWQSTRHEQKQTKMVGKCVCSLQ